MFKKNPYVILADGMIGDRKQQGKFEFAVNIINLVTYIGCLYYGIYKLYLKSYNFGWNLGSKYIDFKEKYSNYMDYKLKSDLSDESLEEE